MHKSLCLAILLLWINLVIGQEGPKYVEGQYLVQLKESKSDEPIFSNTKNIRCLHKASNLYLLEFDLLNSNAAIVESNLRQDASVIHFKKNRLASLRTVIPNDSLFTEQWSLSRIEADRFWEIGLGDVTPNRDSIVIAVIDNGYDLQHEDLQGSFWRNKNEIANDGIDNDNNGYVDDVWGPNLALQNGNHDIKTHGTQVIGSISANSNNDIGVTGVTWGAKVMAMSPAISEAGALAGLGYAYDQRKLYNDSNGSQGAFVVAMNMSFGFDMLKCESAPIWDETFDMLGEEGILIIGATVNRDWNIDQVGDVPTSCLSDYLITVTNTTKLDKKYIGENVSQGAGYGVNSIDLGAPGVQNFSTEAFDYYDFFEGTSSSTPHVAGAVALLYSSPCSLFQSEVKTDPGAAAKGIKRAILNGTDKFAALEPYTKTSGRLNVWNAFTELATDYALPGSPLSILLYPNPSDGMLTLELEAQNPKFQSIEVIDYLGRIVHLEEIPAFCLENQYDLDLTHLSSGIYILRMTDGEESSSQRLIIL